MKTAFTPAFSWFASAVTVGLLVCCTVTTQVSAQTNCVTPPAGLVSWWRGESNALDAAGTNNGTLVNGVTYEQGTVGSAFRFGTASGQRVWVPDSPAFQLTNSLTIEGWFKIYGGCALVQRGDNRPGLDPFTLALQPDGTLDFQITHSYNAGDSIDLRTPAAVPTNVWKHLAATLNGTTGTMRIYVDGQVVAETNTTVRPLGPLEPAYDASLGLGNCAGHSIEYPFVGLADEVGIYSRALSATEIQAIYNAGSAGKFVPPSPPTCVPAPSNLVSWWRAESNALDSIGGNNGVLSNGVTFVPGRVGQGFNFNGVNSFAQVSNSAALSLSNDFTLELWFKDNGSSSIVGLIAKRPSSGACNFGINMVTGGAGVLQVYFLDPVTSATFQESHYSPLPPTGVFHHLAATFRQMNSTQVEVKTFIDGQWVKADTFTASLARTVNNAPVTIGCTHPVGGEFFKGVIDEASIYSRALSTNEIQAIYNAGSAGKCVTATAPFITSQPTNQTVTVGGTASFTVTAGGTQPLSYQWRLGGTNLNGATASSLVLANVQLANAGIYSVVVSNSTSTATSSNAVLTVNPAPPCVTPPTGLVSWWRGESNALDSVGSNNGEFVNNVTFTNGRVGRGFLLDGVNSYVRVPHHPSLNFSNALTVELWFQDLGSVQQFYGLVAKRGGGALDHGPINYGISVEKAGPNGVVIYFNDPTVAGVDEIEVSRYLPVPVAGVFHHLAATFRQVDATHVELGTFIDGQLVKTQAFVANLANAVNNYPVTIGASAPVGEFFKGVIDEVSLYNRALATNEIRAIYNAGSAGKCTTLPPMNHPPVADATATKPLLIVPANCSPTVVLDGSRSSDPDADPLQYRWFKTGETNAFATGVVAVVTLPLGAQTLTLVVDDGLATDAQTFAVELITPAQAVERLMALVNSQAQKPNPLVATLSAALASIERCNVTPAINQLEAFQNKVRAQVAPGDPALARQFVQAAQDIIDALSRDCASGKPHGKIGKLHRHSNGKVGMEFSAPNGAVYLIEASTNLVDWEKIGVAIETGPGEFEFEDPDAAHVPTRFYRIVVP